MKQFWQKHWILTLKFTHKGLFIQSSDAIFSVEYSVSEIDSFFCQQTFKSIHGLWMCVCRGVCMQECAQLCMFVCVPDMRHGLSLLFVSTGGYQY